MGIHHAGSLPRPPSAVVLTLFFHVGAILLLRGYGSLLRTQMAIKLLLLQEVWLGDLATEQKIQTVRLHVLLLVSEAFLMC